jgi:hypothetical protein
MLPESADNQTEERDQPTATHQAEILLFIKSQTTFGTFVVRTSCPPSAQGFGPVGTGLCALILLLISTGESFLKVFKFKISQYVV